VFEHAIKHRPRIGQTIRHGRGCWTSGRTNEKPQPKGTWRSCPASKASCIQAECSARFNDAGTPFVPAFGFAAPVKRCSPPSRDTIGATLGHSELVPLISLRKEKALDLRPRSGATLCGSKGRAMLLTSMTVLRNRSPNATNA
jgi:hypothetical protein